MLSWKCRKCLSTQKYTIYKIEKKIENQIIELQGVVKAGLTLLEKQWQPNYNCTVEICRQNFWRTGSKNFKQN